MKGFIAPRRRRRIRALNSRIETAEGAVSKREGFDIKLIDYAAPHARKKPFIAWRQKSVSGL
jgi:hypothetical protein